MRDDAGEPLCDEGELDALVQELVAGTAPRMFAPIREEGEREGAWVRAWGPEFGGHADVIVTRERLSRRYCSAAEAHRTMSLRRKLRLVRCPPPAQATAAA